MKDSRWRPRPIHGVLLIALVLAAGGVALGVSSSGVIHACVNSKTRVVTIPKSGHCGRGASSISWNLKGQTGAQGAQGNPGRQGNPGIGSSASDSQTATKPLGSTDTTLLTAHINVPAFSRVEASGGGTFQYTPSGTGAAELDCGLLLTGPAGTTAMGNRTQEDFSGSVAYKEPGSAGGAVTASAGVYTVTLACHQVVSNAALSFVHGDLNVVAAGP